MVQWKQTLQRGRGRGRETETERRKKSNCSRWNWFIFRAKGGKWVRLGGRRGRPCNIKLSTKQAARLVLWQQCGACSLNTALEKKHAHFCYLSNAVGEWLIVSVAWQWSLTLSYSQSLGGGERNRFYMMYHMHITVKDLSGNFRTFQKMSVSNLNGKRCAVSRNVSNMFIQVRAQHNS